MAEKDLKLFNKEILARYTDAATRDDMREKNCLCITFLGYLLTREETDKALVHRQRIYNALGNKNRPGEESSYQKALNVFISKKEAFKNSNFVQELINLFRLNNKKPGEEMSLLNRYFSATGENIDYTKVEEPNIIEVAKLFDEAFGNEPKFAEVDKKVAQMLVNTQNAMKTWGGREGGSEMRA